MRGLGLPRMRKPDGLGAEYDFPTDVRSLTSVDLGEIRLKLEAWWSWFSIVLGDEQILLDAFESIYEIKLGIAMAEERAKRAPVEGKVIAKEILLGLAIKANPDLQKLHEKLIDTRSKVKTLAVQVDIYDHQLKALSREQTRRDGGSSSGSF